MLRQLGINEQKKNCVKMLTELFTEVPGTCAEREREHFQDVM
jgi:hypothetical protein